MWGLSHRYYGGTRARARGGRFCSGEADGQTDLSRRRERRGAPSGGSPFIPEASLVVTRYREPPPLRMATLTPVIVTYCEKCGLPPEYCEYNTEVEHGAGAASSSSAGVEAKLGQLSVEGGEERGAAGEAVRAGCASVLRARRRGALGCCRIAPSRALRRRGGRAGSLKRLIPYFLLGTHRGRAQTGRRRKGRARRRSPRARSRSRNRRAPAPASRTLRHPAHSGRRPRSLPASPAPLSLRLPSSAPCGTNASASRPSGGSTCTATSSLTRPRSSGRSLRAGAASSRTPRARRRSTSRRAPRALPRPLALSPCRRNAPCPCPAPALAMPCRARRAAPLGRSPPPPRCRARTHTAARQGDFMDELIDFLAQEFKDIPEDDIKTVDKAK